eukprot:TRINITY_DN25318_c0_g1_i1.p1 TRINITY_DN25318_c0_g1~~TRINITY_DN25318_c0_g1_i1.p1  ORF type:complete len:509 (-),score=89.97 TRINITY_DN25318_c0_g1_i1:2843-4267(-)
MDDLFPQPDAASIYSSESAALTTGSQRAVLPLDDLDSFLPQRAIPAAVIQAPQPIIQLQQPAAVIAVTPPLFVNDAGRQQQQSQKQVLQEALNILVQQQQLLQPQVMAGDPAAHEKQRHLQQQISFLQQQLTQQPQQRPTHIQLQNVQAQEIGGAGGHESPFSNFSGSPPMSPFSSPPASPLPAHFRKKSSPKPGNSSVDSSPYPAHATGSAPSGKSTLSGQKRRGSRAVDERTLAIRRRKHNELEIKRRKKMNDKYEELYRLLGCPHTRVGILDSAIARIKTSDAQIRAMNIIMEALKKSAPNMQTLSAESSNGSLSQPKQELSADSSTIFQNLSNSLRHVNTPVMVTALNGSILMCNQSLCDCLGFSNDVISKTTLFSMVSESDLSDVFSVTKKVLSAEVPCQVIDLKMVHADGYTKTLHSIISGVVSSNGDSNVKPIALMIVFSSIEVPSEEITGGDLGDGSDESESGNLL